MTFEHDDTNSSGVKIEVIGVGGGLSLIHI